MSRFYFAHPISDYGTVFEGQVIERLRRVWLTIENPNQPHHQQGYAKKSMAYFTEDVLPACDGCVFLAFPGGLVGAGVAMEVQHFLDRGQPVFEIAEDGMTLNKCHVLDPARLLTREETRGVSKVLRTLPNGGR